MTKVAMISSTSLDLPEHRKLAMDACQRMGVFPMAMEHLPAGDADAIKVSLAMVDQADIYIGIFARRYGYIPEGHDISITEMEFNRAVKRKIPIFVFLIHEDHLLPEKMFEKSELAQEKLEALKARASTGRTRAEFKSSENFHALLLHALADWKSGDQSKNAKNYVDRSDQLLARQTYLDWLRRSCESVELLGLDLKDAQNVRLGQIYVPAVTVLTDERREASGASTHDLWHELLLHRLGEESLYVPGAPGAGKSTFCRWVALCVANGAVPTHSIQAGEEYEESLPDTLCGRLPILCQLREWTQQDATWIKGNGRWTRTQLENALAAWLDATRPGGLSSKLALDHLKRGRILLIFDGIDEVPESAGGNRPRRNLLSGLADALPDWLKVGNRILITSRPYGLDDAERRQLGIPLAELSDLPNHLQGIFVRRWYAAANPALATEKAAALSDHLGQRRDLDELRPNPMLLTALCVKFDEGQRLPSGLYRLYDSVINQVLHKRYQNNEVERDRARMRLAAIALAMHTGAPARPRVTPEAEVGVDEVDQALAALAMSDWAAEPGAIDAAEKREDLLSNSGLLLPRSNRRAAFYHLSFQEFFAGVRMRRIPINLEAILDRHAAAPSWRRTLTFLFCAIADQDSAESAIQLYSRLVPYLEPARLAVDANPALLFADCLEIIHARSWNLSHFASPFRQACDQALRESPPMVRAQLWRTLGRLALDDRPGVGTKNALPNVEWVKIPSGKFLFGDEELKPLTLKGFQIARHPITNMQFQCFVADGGYQNEYWWRGLKQMALARPRWSDPNHPRENVSWYEAVAFCRWLDTKLRERRMIKKDEQIRLPTEQEWEKAARGVDGRKYPWGEHPQGTFYDHRANVYSDWESQR